MNIGYVILLLLVLVHASTGVFLYMRARQQHPGPKEAEEAPPEDSEVP